MSRHLTASKGYAPAAAQHADWLTLVEPRGQFLTLPVLRRAYPDGLPALSTDTARVVRERARETNTADTAHATLWIEYLLKDVLGWGVRMLTGARVPDYLTFAVPERQTTLRPDYALTDAEGKTRTIVTRHDSTVKLDARIPGSTWAATPIDRMALLCRAMRLDVGLVTNGREVVLVYAPADKAGGHATWDTTLFAEGAEGRLLDAFVTVLGAASFFARGADGTLEALLEQSANAQAELTSTLGLQVRRAVELLVAAISRANLDREGQPLRGVHPQRVYQAAATVVMRLVFMLYAEERGLLRLGEPLYDENYAASTLLEQLRAESDTAGDEPLELRSAAWHRLLASFRALYGGVSHDRLRMPPLGGSLFDPDRFPFLEGRADGTDWKAGPSQPLHVDDLTIREILTALQFIETRDAGVTEARRLSFRALDVEQIGHVYEGLLDHSAKRANGIIAGLVGKPGMEPEVELAHLEDAAAKDRKDLIDYLVGQTGRNAKTVMALLDKSLTADQARLLRTVCDNDERTVARLTPFASLIRDDLRGLPTVISDNAVYVTETSHRRDTGTEYTTKELADEIVRYTLEPLVYSPGPRDNPDRAAWQLRSPDEILQLTVCDHAVGSGAILVAACRYLADRLAEARLECGQADVPHAAFDSDYRDEDDLIVQARRDIADRCLFGVDRDPMAIEMTKLSLWLTTMSKDRPFTFVDHAIQAGDSLLGLTDISQVVAFHMDPARGRELSANLFEDLTADIQPLVAGALALRRELEARPVIDARDVEWKSAMNARADASLADAKIVADLVVGAAIVSAGKDTLMEERLLEVRERVTRALAAEGQDRAARFAELGSQAEGWLNQGNPNGDTLRKPMHWALAFPEVFAAGGFSAMVGNSPFLGGKRISGANGTDMRDYLVRWVAGGTRGHADLVAYFFLQAGKLSRTFGLLATNTIAQGDTREVGLDQLAAAGFTIYRAVKSRPWPGSANVDVSQVWVTADSWAGQVDLDGARVEAITPQLEAPGRVAGMPRRLAANNGLSFIGTYVLGMGFIIPPDEAARWIEADPRNAEVLRPYLSGDDLNNHPKANASRWIINFHDWSVEEAAAFAEPFSRVEREVMPERTRLREDGQFKLRKPLPQRWWQYADKRPALYKNLALLDSCIALTLHTKAAMPHVVDARQVFSHALAVFASEDPALLAILSSQFHWLWAVRYGSSLGDSIRYTPTDVFETFPMPNASPLIRELGTELIAKRNAAMERMGTGLTSLYNAVNDRQHTDLGVTELRDVHRRIDREVRDAYGWDDLDLHHGHHETPQGERWTVRPDEQGEILDRLLELNHDRHRLEQATAPALVRKPAKNAAENADDDQLTLEMP